MEVMGGVAGVMPDYYDQSGSTGTEVLKILPPAQGGLAGFISEGAVTINNIASGTTKGRIAP